MQEENRILDKTNRQKVLEVEKLTQTIKELEEAILAGGAAANAIRDYQRQISELHVRLLARSIIFSRAAITDMFVWVVGWVGCGAYIDRDANPGHAQCSRRRREPWKES